MQRKTEKGKQMFIEKEKKDKNPPSMQNTELLLSLLLQRIPKFSINRWNKHFSAKSLLIFSLYCLYLDLEAVAIEVVLTGNTASTSCVILFINATY